MRTAARRGHRKRPPCSSAFRICHLQSEMPNRPPPTSKNWKRRASCRKRWAKIVRYPIISCAKSN